ncbi:endolytic transglycosylase MltG [Hydrogenophaga sp. 5NK40-0174]|uniref:endolytic transglycosylase MltG n=1 Tax=Hydrogenophaga sp. 5NK40-0174 TaxID=3127649 RepID=UPI00310466AC
MFRTFARLLSILTILVLAAGAYAVWWLDQPLTLGEGAQTHELTVVPGMSAKAVASAAVSSGVQTRSDFLYAWFRLSGKGRDIKAGTYALERGLTPKSLLDKLVRGDQILQSVTLVEGWNVRDVLRAIGEHPDLEQDIEGLTPVQIMAKIDREGVHPEGRFFPETYHVPKHAKASDVLRQAARMMDEKLDEAWGMRAEGTPLKSKDELLILASIIEKETGAPADRPMIGGVFANRLRIGMRLQTDPTVIYGLGEQFDGNLRRRDLESDTPYNTYTRAGLPPTPISMPGWASLEAAVRPASTKALYFVAKGDGSSHFSNSLGEHNAAVRRYILKRQ